MYVEDGTADGKKEGKLMANNGIAVGSSIAITV
jgi:hypothetical protein